AYASARSGWTEITDRTAHGSEATISAAARPSTACSGIAMRSGSPSATRAPIVASAGPSVMVDAYSGGSDTSSRAALISSGTVTSSLASTAANCEAVRTPRIGAAAPGRADTAGGDPQSSSRRRHSIDDPPGPVVEIARDERLVLRRCRARVGRRAMAIFARQNTSAERRPWQQPESQIYAGGEEFTVRAAVDQRILGTERHERGPSWDRRLPCRSPPALPSGQIRHPGIADTARANRVVEGGQCFIQRR